MAMIKCQECGKKISSTASACPSCGAPISVAAAKPDRRLSWIHIMGLIVGGFILFGYLAQDPKPATTAAPAQQEPSGYEVALAMKKEALSQVQLIDYSWSKGVTGVVLSADFTIQNKSLFAVKDIEITCDCYGASGTQIGQTTNILYDLIPAGQSKRFKDFNMGFIHSQAARAGCKITNLLLN